MTRRAVRFQSSAISEQQLYKHEQCQKENNEKKENSQNLIRQMEL